MPLLLGVRGGVASAEPVKQSLLLGLQQESESWHTSRCFMVNELSDRTGESCPADGKHFLVFVTSAIST